MHDRDQNAFDSLRRHRAGIEQPLQEHASNERDAERVHLLHRQAEFDVEALGQIFDGAHDDGVAARALLDQRQSEWFVRRGDGPGLGDDARPAAVRIVPDHDPHELANERSDIRRGGAGALVAFHPLLHPGAVHREEQIGLAVEVGVDGSLGHAGGQSNLLEGGGVKPVLEKDAAGAFDEPGAGVGFLGLSGQPDDSHTDGI